MIKTDEVTRNRYRRLIRVPVNTPSIVKSVGHAIPLLRSANLICPIYKKKNLFFQFLLESGILDTNLSNDFLAKKW